MQKSGIVQHYLILARMSWNTFNQNLSDFLLGLQVGVLAMYALRFHVCSILRGAGEGAGSKPLPCLLDLLEVPLNVWQL